MNDPHYLNITALEVDAGNAAEGTITAIDASVTFGAFMNASLELTTGAADTIVVRVYDGTSNSILLGEWSVVFLATNDKAVVSLDLPASFFNTLAVSFQATGSGRKVTIRPTVQNIKYVT